MRDFLRGCLVWFVGYPLSVVAASAVLTAPAWLTTGYTTLTSVVDVTLAASPVVSFFSALPAVLTPASRRVSNFVAAGTRTGGSIGLFVVLAYVMVFLSVVGVQALKFLASGTFDRAAGDVLLSAAASLTVFLSLFVVAGAVGGFVFGLFAAYPYRNSA